jgi:hypothetical protein
VVSCVGGQGPVVGKAPAHCQADVERTRVAIKNISLAKDGAVPSDPAVRPSRGQELQLGPGGSVLDAASLTMSH